jgi:hypothetical protein
MSTFITAARVKAEADRTSNPITKALEPLVNLAIAGLNAQDKAKLEPGSRYAHLAPPEQPVTNTRKPQMVNGTRALRVRGHLVPAGE